MNALSNPLRSRMVLALRTGGPSSVRELGLRLVVDPKILYYPLKKLVDCGLVRATGSTKSRRRTETVYGLTANRMDLPQSADLSTRQRLMRTTLRCAEEEAMNAQAASVHDSSPMEAMEIMRVPLWLSPDDRLDLFQRLKEVVAEFTARSSQGENELLMWTSLIVPVPKRR